MVTFSRRLDIYRYYKIPSIGTVYPRFTRVHNVTDFSSFPLHLDIPESYGFGLRVIIRTILQRPK
jgi:hypothetical protein